MELTQQQEAKVRLFLARVERKVDIGPTHERRPVEVTGIGDERRCRVVRVTRPQGMALRQRHLMRSKRGDGDEEVAKVAQRDIRVQVSCDKPHAGCERGPARETRRDQRDLERSAMDEWFIGAPLVGDESCQLPALLGGHVVRVNDGLLPAPSVYLLARKRRTVGAPVAKPLELFRLLQREIGEQPSVGVDRNAMDIGRMDSRGIFAHQVLIGDHVGVVETRQQILAQPPRENRVERRVWKRERRRDEKPHAVPVSALHEGLRQVHQPAEVVLGGAESPCSELLGVRHSRC